MLVVGDVWEKVLVDAQFEIYDTRKDPVGSIGDYSLNGITLYDYQERTIGDFIKAKRGIA